MGREYYDLLGVEPDASTEEIAAAYRERLKETHPDVSDASDAKERTRHLIEAKEILTDETERARYDRLGHERYVGLENHDSPGATTSGRRGAGTDEPWTAGDDGSEHSSDARDEDAADANGWPGDERRSEAGEAAGPHGGSEAGEAAGPHGGSEADETAGPHGRSEADETAGPHGGSEAGETAGPHGRSDAGETAGPHGRSDTSRSYAVGGAESGIDWDEWADADWDEISDAVWEEVKESVEQEAADGTADEGSTAGARPGGFGTAPGAATGGNTSAASSAGGASGTSNDPSAASATASADTAAAGGDGDARSVGWYRGGDPSGTTRESWSAGGETLTGQPWENWTPGDRNDRYDQETFPPHRILSPVQTGLLLAIAFLTYPLFAFGAVFPAFGGPTRLLLAILLVFVVALLIVLPQLGVVVFGLWAALFPVVFAHLGVSIVAVESLTVIGTVLGSLGLSVLSWILTRPPAL